jgi:3-methyladenine DNA glycosylase AlkD
MNERIIELAIAGFEKLRQKTTGHFITKDVRNLSAELFKKVEDKTIGSVLSICNDLLSLESWESGLIAFDFAYRVRKQYNIAIFDVFEDWLRKYCTDWDTVDDFCTHAFGELLLQNPDLFPKILDWTKRDEWWMRRASAVIMIPVIKKSNLKEINVFQISDQLMYDEHYLVLKGYGWMLKELSKFEPVKVIEYLVKHKETMPRTAFRYALEKLNDENRKRLMGK